MVMPRFHSAAPPLASAKTGVRPDTRYAGTELWHVVNPIADRLPGTNGCKGVRNGS